MKRTLSLTLCGLLVSSTSFAENPYFVTKTQMNNCGVHAIANGFYIGLETLGTLFVGSILISTFPNKKLSIIKQHADYSAHQQRLSLFAAIHTQEETVGARLNDPSLKTSDLKNILSSLEQFRDIANMPDQDLTSAIKTRIDQIEAEKMRLAKQIASFSNLQAESLNADSIKVIREQAERKVSRYNHGLKLLTGAGGLGSGILIIGGLTVAVLAEDTSALINSKKIDGDVFYTQAVVKTLEAVITAQSRNSKNAGVYCNLLQ